VRIELLLLLAAVAAATVFAAMYYYCAESCTGKLLGWLLPRLLALEPANGSKGLLEDLQEGAAYLLLDDAALNSHVQQLADEPPPLLVRGMTALVRAAWIALPLVAAHHPAVGHAVQAGLILALRPAARPAAMAAISAVGGGKRLAVGRLLPTLAVGSKAIMRMLRASRIAAPLAAPVATNVVARAGLAPLVTPLLMNGVLQRAFGGAALGAVVAFLV
jgi:hypothetical protein